MQTKILSCVVLLSFFILIIELVRRERLTFKYAAGWMFLSALGMFFIIFDQILFGIAQWFGFTLPSNFIFYAMLCLFVFLSLLLTTFLCRQEKRNETMAQKIAILQMEVDKLRGRGVPRPRSGSFEGS